MEAQILFNDEEDPKEVLNKIFDTLRDMGYKFDYLPVNYPNNGNCLMFGKHDERERWSDHLHANGKIRLVCTGTAYKEKKQWNIRLDCILGKSVNDDTRMMLIDHCKDFKE